MGEGKKYFELFEYVLDCSQLETYFSLLLNVFFDLIPCVYKSIPVQSTFLMSARSCNFPGEFQHDVFIPVVQEYQKSQVLNPDSSHVKTLACKFGW